MPNINISCFFNFTFSFLGFLYYKVFLCNNLFVLYSFTILKNIGLLYSLNYYTKFHKHIKNINNIQINKIDIYNCFLVSFFDVLSILLCKKRNYSSILLEILLFIPVSFIYEIIFDFFHYITHRLVHTKYLYKYIHKKHHEYNENTTILATFHQDPLDLLFTNLLPMYLTSKIFSLSYPQYFIFLFYKTFIEISGHLGKKINGYSFSQFVWLSKIFNIELYNLDHYNHHTKLNCNYAKRFNLWDKIFCTYYKE
jgi:sterol desaturase/sphingolipid hydroxylase (fatty acid hydroxylase superfamily)